jgi:hypothetical protein
MKLSLPYKPDLTPFKLCGLLAEKLGSKYEFSTAGMRQSNLQRAIHGPIEIVVAKKSSFVGVMIQIKHDESRGETILKLWSDPPSHGWFVLAVLIPPLILVFPIIIALRARPVMRDLKSALTSMSAV